MGLETARHRLAFPAVVGAALMLGLPALATAQGGDCQFGEEGNDLLVQQVVPGGGTVTYISRPHLVCPDGVQIWADSAVTYAAQSLQHLIGRVRYRDGSRELTSSEARYFSNVGRLQATGRVRVVDRADGSQVENGDLVYLRETDFRDEESMTVTTGADGLRPQAIIPPPAPDSATTDAPTDSTAIDPRPPAREPSPYTIVADRILFRGSSYFDATGNVEIERDSLFAYGDSAEYAEDMEQLVLVGSARVVSSEYVLVGRTITIGTASDGANEIVALREALLTGDDLTLTAPQIRLYLTEGAVERLVAVPLQPRGSAAPSAPPDADGLPRTGAAGVAPGPVPPPAAELATTEPDSADLVRPVAVAERFELTADSLELTAPGEVVDRIFAAGRARSVSQARDSLNVELLPTLARQDWLEGDTIIVILEPPPADSLSPPLGADVEDSGREYTIERIIARVGARSLYRLPPQDSTAKAGVDPPAVHYVVGDEITIHMLQGEVEAMEVVGQTRGVHLEPLSRAAAAADTARADSTAAPPGQGATPPGNGVALPANPGSPQPGGGAPAANAPAPSFPPWRRP